VGERGERCCDLIMEVDRNIYSVPGSGDLAIT
jgi:hypothetical protein